MTNEDEQVKKETCLGLNLDDFSINDLQKYIVELKNEIDRVNRIIIKKNLAQNEASKYFS